MNRNRWVLAEIGELVGKTLKAIENVNDEELRLETADGICYRFIHHQDCCESVYIESIVGDLSDVVGEPLLVAEDVDSEQTESDDGDSYTWTFYKFATRKGYVDVRWFGTSNGYYSERVDFEKRV